MIRLHCTCVETQAALGDSLLCSFCWSGAAEDPKCVKCPHCSRLQIPHKPDSPCAVCEKPLTAGAQAMKRYRVTQSLTLETFVFASNALEAVEAARSPSHIDPWLPSWTGAVNAEVDRDQPAEASRTQPEGGH